MNQIQFTYRCRSNSSLTSVGEAHSSYISVSVIQFTIDVRETKFTSECERNRSVIRVSEHSLIKSVSEIEINDNYT